MIVCSSMIHNIYLYDTQVNKIYIRKKLKWQISAKTMGNTLTLSII